ncbi:phosphoribosylamine--glycine ligase [Allopusillimonas ginsengisoli]|uniref:phosphoribosylamine--glycine ligase n=1 Tax=Allopusillimonas ginsengisoli TaxID=453575 RepID=UPI00101F6D22|nr:phosphoribosylamine--glycine ligase [Allopusillimonas ginsengisoli]TEA78118.1 phosphoribosylamine--glycine ligase [Allopusillimonas ginsengisoli]
MKLLVIGGGGREHALAWRLARAPRVQTVFVAPGNGGTATAQNIQNVSLSTNEELVAFAQKEKIAFTVVGPEAPLAAGVVDAFRAAGLKIFGPTQAAAQLESSKDYAKAFMVRHNIPTAAYQTFTDPAEARAYIAAQGAPIVVKADGLAAGKGVVVAATVQEAQQAVDQMLGDGSFGAAGARVVIEECLQGEEASFIVMCDGRNVLALATSQDHKRLKDGDQGPNTGGMGAYSPAPVITPALHNRIMREVIQPTMAGMARDGLPYTGFLYAGLMIGDGPDATRPLKVLEFNCRMGDPETQPIMMRIKSDLTKVFELAVAGRLDEADIEWDRRCALGVVVAAKDYPAQPRTGDIIDCLPQDTDDCVVFHAGTKLDNGVLKTTGGRVLCVTVLADSVKRAQAAAYGAIAQTHFDGQQYRSDIGWRAVP